MEGSSVFEEFLAVEGFKIVLWKKFGNSPRKYGGGNKKGPRQLSVCGNRPVLPPQKIEKKAL